MPFLGWMDLEFSEISLVCDTEDISDAYHLFGDAEYKNALTAPSVYRKVE